MFDLDEMSRWERALERLSRHEPEPEAPEPREAAAEVPAALRELEDA